MYFFLSSCTDSITTFEPIYHHFSFFSHFRFSFCISYIRLVFTSRNQKRRLRRIVCKNSLGIPLKTPSLTIYIVRISLSGSVTSRRGNSKPITRRETSILTILSFSFCFPHSRVVFIRLHVRDGVIRSSNRKKMEPSDPDRSP